MTRETTQSLTKWYCTFQYVGSRLGRQCIRSTAFGTTRTMIMVGHLSDCAHPSSPDLAQSRRRATKTPAQVWPGTSCDCVSYAICARARAAGCCLERVLNGVLRALHARFPQASFRMSTKSRRFRNALPSNSLTEIKGS